MAISKADAIVVHTQKQGETSKIVTLYSKEFGKFTAMAKGSRGVRSKYLGTLETFNHINVVFYYKESRGMQYMSQASIIEPFQDIHARLGKMALAAIPIEIILRGEEEHHSQPALFQLLVSALQTLEANEKNLRNIIRAFIIRYMVLSGFEPSLKCCSSCGETTIQEFCEVSLQFGHYYCRNCGAVEDGMKLPAKAVAFLRWFMEAPIAQTPQAVMPADIGRDCDVFLYRYMSRHIEPLATLRSVEHLQSLESNLAQDSA